MIINIDIKGLEVVAAAYLSGDPTLKAELKDKQDIHSNNQVAFNLPSRLVAKVLKFRLIYGGTEHSFVRDPDFMPVSSNKKYWANVIEQYYNKYNGIYEWHQQLIAEVVETGKIQILTGRSYIFDWKENWKREKELPITQIKNYPVKL